MMKGIVFNIQKFSVHDGTGIRTMVFLKGCPLRCTWCSNPESQDMAPERAFNPNHCLGTDACGRCAKNCPTGAITSKQDNSLASDTLCTNCFACVDACPTGARTLYGSEMTVDEVLKRVEEDEAFYARSGGGMTLSGGEALAQPQFVNAILKEAKRRHINTAMETCGYAAYDDLACAARSLDMLIFDIKHINSKRHKDGTGVGNERIIKNFLNICEDFPNLNILVRTPIIPGFNDNAETISAIRKLIPARDTITYELLTYHRMGQPKYEYLGRGYAHEGVKADQQRMEQLRAIAQSG